MQELLDSRPSAASTAAYPVTDRAAIRNDEQLPAPLRGIDRLDAAALLDVLDEMDSGVLVCTDTGRVLMANDAARRELQRAQLLVLDPAGQVVAVGDGATTAQRWRAALLAAAQGRRRQLLAMSDGERRLMVALAPLGQGASARVVVLVGRRQPAPELAVEMWGSQCELTVAERAVLQSLLVGERVTQIARRRGVGLATVRTQVGALRAKLGVTRLEDMVRLAAGLPPLASALRTPPLPMTGLARDAAGHGLQRRVNA